MPVVEGRPPPTVNLADRMMIFTDCLVLAMRHRTF